MTNVDATVGVALGQALYELENVKELVRSALALAGSPLDKLISPGQTIFVKPNLIAASREGRTNEWEQIITHPSVISCVLEEIIRRLQNGRIILGDAPQTDSDFSAISGRLNLDELKRNLEDRWPHVRIDVLDLRQESWIQRGNVTVKRRRLWGDPRGAVLIDLARASALEGHSINHRYYGADYDFADTSRHHAGGRHEYLVSRSVLEADVFVNIPKLKTHKKAGVTLNLKNLVGINADKNYLPHYSLGSPLQGGDEFPDSGPRRRLESLASQAFKRALAASGGKGPIWGAVARRLGVRVFGPTNKVVRSGNWWGNDTIWRMCLDLNRVLLWFDGQGKQRTSPKPFLSIVDGIIAGDGDGPVDADAVPLGIIACGSDPVAVDLVCTRLVGFDWRRIPILSQARATSTLPISSAEPERLIIRSNVLGEVVGVDKLRPIAHFRPHFGWKGHIELSGLDVKTSSLDCSN